MNIFEDNYTEDSIKESKMYRTVSPASKEFTK